MAKDPGIVQPEALRFRFLASSVVYRAVVGPFGAVEPLSAILVRLQRRSWADPIGSSKITLALNRRRFRQTLNRTAFMGRAETQLVEPVAERLAGDCGRRLREPRRRHVLFSDLAVANRTRPECQRLGFASAWCRVDWGVPGAW